MNPTNPTHPEHALAEIVQEARRTFGDLAESGLQGVDCTRASLEKIRRWGTVPTPRETFPASTPEARQVGAVPIPPETLAAIREDLGDCRRCKLAAGRLNIVFGAGAAHAGLMFVGEGPGFDEDRQGEPFVGAAGRLLTRIIQAMNLTREQVYIGNVVKCRPPGNRNPEPDEIATCLPFLRRQIRAVAPDFICALGNVAAQTLLETRQPISRLRGRFHDYPGGVRVMPTYHPAYLLRNPASKREVWEDVQQLMKAMGIDGRP